jgi:hypothetical protein
MTIDLDHIVTKTAGATKKIAGGAARAATKVVDGTKSAVERAACRDQIKEKYRTIGELIYKSHSGAEDNTLAIKRLCADVDELNKKLSEL